MVTLLTLNYRIGLLYDGLINRLGRLGLPIDEAVPVYKEVPPRFLFIGVSHRRLNESRTTKRRIRVLKNKLAGLDHLVMEGTSPEAVPFSYEDLAAQHFNGSIYFPQSNYNHRAALQKHGASPNLRLLFNMLELIGCVYFDDRIPQNQRLGYAQHYFDSVSSDYREPKEVLQKMRKGLSILLAEVADRPDLLDTWYTLASELIPFEGRIRDNEVYAPFLLRMRDNVDGKIGVILGKEHLDYNISLLLGQPKEIILWEEVKRGLSQKALSALEYFSQFERRYLTNH